MERPSRVGAVATAVAAFVALGLGLYVLVAALAGMKRSSVRESWNASLGTKDEILARYPKAEANASALELERLAVSLGIDVAPRMVVDRARPEQGHRREWKTLMAESRGYLKDQLGKIRRAVDPPPAALAAFLLAHESDLDAIRRHLAAGVVPRWEIDIERPNSMPLPNLASHIELQKLLALDALVKTHEGRREVAFRDLDASWILLQALTDHPLLITQLIVMSEARLILGVLRQVGDRRPEWSERLAAHDFRGSFTRALKFEGWSMSQLADGAGFTSRIAVTDRLASGFVRPYFLLCLADASDRLRRRVDRFERVDALCDYDLAEQGADLEVPVPWWSAIGLMNLELESPVDRLAQLELDLELTLLVLEADQVRASTDAWPVAAAGGEVSRACPQERWVHAVDGSGALGLDLTRAVAWPDIQAHGVPTSFTLPPD